MYVCLQGLTSEVSVEKEIQNEGHYRSKVRCRRHENCVAVVCAWPVETLRKKWESKTTCQDPLVKEASCCSLCGENASGLCIYGGHMVCWKHSNEWVGKAKKTSSPLQCMCEPGKKSPIWPNPFEWMYSSSRGLILEMGDKREEGSFLGDHLLTCVGSEGHRIRMWAYQGDQFPQVEIWNTGSDGLERRKRIVAWRLCVEPSALDKKGAIYSLKRCKHFWFSAACSNTLKKIKSFFDEKEGWELVCHESKFFMFAYDRAQKMVMCLSCRRSYAVQLFDKSECCLFPKTELETGMHCGGRRWTSM